MTPTNLTQFILTALDMGMNKKRLLVVSGLSASEFDKYVRDELFSYDQSDAIEREIRRWRRGE